VTFNHGDGTGLTAGNGVLLDIDGNSSILISYDSLKTTGFELIGGVKVVCKLTSRGFPDDILPCPRGMVYRVWATSEGPQPIQVGTIYGGRPLDVDPDNNLILQIASATPAENGGTPPNIVGVGLTNTIVPWDPAGHPDEDWGYAVVGVDHELMMIRRVSHDGVPIVGPFLAGRQAYLSDDVSDVDGLYGTFALEPTPEMSCPIGVVSTLGPRDADGPIAIIWTLVRTRRQLATTKASFPVAASTALADVPGLILSAEKGKTYRIRAIVPVDVSDGGSRVVISSLVAPANALFTYAFYSITGTALALLAMFPYFGDIPGIITAGNASGWWTIDGSFEATDDGVVSIQFAQKTSDPSTSQVLSGAYFEVVEQ